MDTCIVMNVKTECFGGYTQSICKPSPIKLFLKDVCAIILRGFYYPAHANQVGVDGVPDFILHDSQQRGPSLDSSLSDSIHLQNASRYCSRL